MPVDSFKADSLAFLCLATIYIPATIYYFVKHILLHPWHSQAMCSSRLESIHSQRQNPSSGDTADRSVSTQFWQQLPPSPLLHGVFKLLLFLACVSHLIFKLFSFACFSSVFTFSPVLQWDERMQTGKNLSSRGGRYGKKYIILFEENHNFIMIFVMFGFYYFASCLFYELISLFK